MLIMHPSLPVGQSSEVSEDQYRDLYRHRGWLPVGDLPDLAELTIGEVTELVGTDPAAALTALISERAGRSRAGLVRHLERVAVTEPAPPVVTTPTAPTSKES